MGEVVTLANYKVWAGITSAADDTRLQVLLDSAHAAARRYCGRDMVNGFESATRTQDYIVDSYELQLEEFPVTSITSITPIFTNNTLGSAMPSSDYNLEASTGIVRINDASNFRTFIDTYTPSGVVSEWNWRPRFERVRVVYVSDGAAADVKTALYRMVDGLYASIRRDMAIGSQSIGSWSVSYASPDAAAQAQAQLLDPFGSGRIWG